MSKSKRRAQEQRRAAFVTERAADALADLILADGELRGHGPTAEQKRLLRELYRTPSA